MTLSRAHTGEQVQQGDRRKTASVQCTIRLRYVRQRSLRSLSEKFRHLFLVRKAIPVSFWLHRYAAKRRHWFSFRI